MSETQDATFADVLDATTDLTGDRAATMRDHLLDELDLPSGWEVADEDVCSTSDESGDWSLATFNGPGDDHASVFVLPGSHMVQVYRETSGWSDPTRSVSDIEDVLN